MRITANDITNKEFKKSFRGYDSDEVDEFLDKIAEDYELLYKENSSLKERILNLEENLNHYSKMEETIQNTLILAQNAADQSKKAAQKEADMILKNANETGQKVLDKAHDDVIKINDDFEKTKKDFTMFRTKFKNFMQSQLEMFENMEKEFIKNYNIGNTIEEPKLREKEIDFLDDEKSEVEDGLILEEPSKLNKDEQKSEMMKTSVEEIKNFFVK